mmetsp:Transcript_17683/g.35492  ORF Transcript_17683/g.35492 Transcript_17683/m.35492 type:complete len:113 (-) Transcript_17683:436-774(-)
MAEILLFFEFALSNICADGSVSVKSTVTRAGYDAVVFPTARVGTALLKFDLGAYSRPHDDNATDPITASTEIRLPTVAALGLKDQNRWAYDGPGGRTGCEINTRSSSVNCDG